MRRKPKPIDPQERDERGAVGVPIVGAHRSTARSHPESELLRKEARGHLNLGRLEPTLSRRTLSVHYERKGPSHVTRATREAGRFFKGR